MSSEQVCVCVCVCVCESVVHCLAKEYHKVNVTNKKYVYQLPFNNKIDNKLTTRHYKPTPLPLVPIIIN